MKKKTAYAEIDRLRYFLETAYAEIDRLELERVALYDQLNQPQPFQFDANRTAVLMTDGDRSAAVTREALG